MPPHLHPRSTFTSSLFATTLFASFFVVGLPHILPCPAPRVAYADGLSTEAQTVTNGTRERKPRRPRKDFASNVEDHTHLHDADKEAQNTTSGVLSEHAGAHQPQSIAVPTNGLLGHRKMKRECPVPKPPGLIGEVLGFRARNDESQNAKPP